MQKHADKLQQEREEQAMSSIKAAVPNVSPAVLALALHEARWDVTAAVQLVGLFKQAHGSMLEELKKVLLLRVHLLRIPVYLVNLASTFM
jgi:hypothetical protein